MITKFLSPVLGSHWKKIYLATMKTPCKIQKLMFILAIMRLCFIGHIIILRHLDWFFIGSRITL